MTSTVLNICISHISTSSTENIYSMSKHIDMSFYFQLHKHNPQISTQCSFFPQISTTDFHRYPPYGQDLESLNMGWRSVDSKSCPLFPASSPTNSRPSFPSAVLPCAAHSTPRCGSPTPRGFPRNEDRPSVSVRRPGDESTEISLQEITSDAIDMSCSIDHFCKIYIDLLDYTWCVFWTSTLIQVFQNQLVVFALLGWSLAKSHVHICSSVRSLVGWVNSSVLAERIQVDTDIQKFQVLHNSLHTGSCIMQ